MGSLEDHMAPWESKSELLGIISEAKSNPKSVKRNVLKHEVFKYLFFITGGCSLSCCVVYVSCEGCNS